MLNERIDPNSIVGSGRVTRYLFAALSTSFIGAGLVRFAYTPLLPVLIESRWFDTSATVYLSAANPAGALFGAVTSTWLARRCSKVFILRGMNVIQVPLSVDIEGGYSDSPDEAGENIKPLLDAGVIGINIEDGEDSPDLLEAKIESVRRTSSNLDIDLFINARTDVYLRSLVPERERVEETINRAARYVMAGADCFFVSGRHERDRRNC